MANRIKGDLTPILGGSSLVRLDSTHFDVLQNRKLIAAIDELRRLSAQSRHYKQPPSLKHHGMSTPENGFGGGLGGLPSCEQLLNVGHVIYLAWEYDEERDESAVVGVLRVARKHLYISDRRQVAYEGHFCCVLDFYVHYAWQSRGHGTRLFAYMLEAEGVATAPFRVAFDNPSVPLLRFLARKHGLVEPIWQNTNYVVFQELFDKAAASGENCGAVDCPPDGWTRSALPRPINTNDAGAAVVGARFLKDAVGAHPAARRARLLQQERDVSLSARGAANNADATDVRRTPSMERGPPAALENASQLQNEARMRKQHVLSSKPLW